MGQGLGTRDKGQWTSDKRQETRAKRQETRDKGRGTRDKGHGTPTSVLYKITIKNPCGYQNYEGAASIAKSFQGANGRKRWKVG